MSWQTSLTFIETPKNHSIIAALRGRMLEGADFAAVFALALPKGIAADFETMAQVMPPRQALTLALRLHRLYTENRSQIRKLLRYPMLLAPDSLGGLALFNHVCFPVLISLIQSFERNPAGMVLLHHGLGTMFFILTLLGAASGALAIWLRRPTARLSAYVLLIQKRRGKFLRRWLGLDFSRYFSCCLREGCPTQTTLTLLQKLPKKPFLKLMSWHVEQALLAGESLETALGTEYLDPSLMQLMRTASRSGQVQPLLESYVEVRQGQLFDQLRWAARGLQLFAYGTIAAMILIVYQILLLPLSIMSQM